MTLKIFKNKVNEYVKSLEKTEYTSNTIKGYKIAINNFIAFAEANNHCEVICKDCFIEYKEYLTHKYAPKTVNLYIIAVNKYLRYMGENGLCIKTLNIQSHNSLENCLMKEEYFLMLDVAKKRKNNAIYYIMRALASTGVRFKGLEYFTVEILKRGSFLATNKGKTRVIVIPPGVSNEILDYGKSKNITSGYIFPDRNKVKPISETTVYRWMKEVAKKAGVDEEKAFPHNLRHLFAKTFMDVHNDLGELADILGHTKIETTRIYTRTSIEEKRKILEVLGL